MQWSKLLLILWVNIYWGLKINEGLNFIVLSCKMENILAICWGLGENICSIFFKKLYHFYVTFISCKMQWCESINILLVDKLKHDFGWVFNGLSIGIFFHICQIFLEKLKWIKVGTMMKGSVFFLVPDFCQVEKFIMFLEECANLFFSLFGENDFSFDFVLGH